MSNEAIMINGTGPSSDAAKKILVLGGSDVGIIAALRVRELRPDYKVSLILKDNFPNFSICGIPMYMAGHVPKPHTNLAHRTRQVIEDSGIELYTETTATAIHADRKAVSCIQMKETQSQEAEEEFTLYYDKLVIGTGAMSVKPKIPGMDLPNVLFLRTIGNMLALEKHLQEKQPKSAVIIGGGYVGLEMAEALALRGIETTVVEKNTRILKTVDEELSNMVQEKLEQNNIQVVHGQEAKSAVTAIKPGCPPDSCHPQDCIMQVETAQGRSVQAEMVLVSVGARPNSDMFEGDKTSYGAIVINKKCETSVPDIYAGGDVVQTYHQMTGLPTYFAIGTVAHKHGRVIAEQICGMEHSIYPGTIFTQSIKLFDTVVARTGMRQEEAEDAGFDAATIDVIENDHKKYVPPFYELRIRFTADQSNGRILGIQILGNCNAEVSKRIDLVAVAIHKESTVDDLIQMDLSYTPPLSAPFDPVQVAAQAWRRKYMET